MEKKHMVLWPLTDTTGYSAENIVLLATSEDDLQ
jgi:hypothetical protein